MKGSSSGTRRPYRRRSTYTERVTIQLTAELRERLETEADAEQTSVADTGREAIMAGLPLLRDRRRKRKRNRTDETRRERGATNGADS